MYMTQHKVGTMFVDSLYICLLFGIHFCLQRTDSVVISDSCDRHTACNYSPNDRITNSKCENGKCICAYGYYGESGDTACVKGRLGDLCSDKENGTTFCQTGDVNSLCDGDTGRCACDVGYTMVSDGLQTSGCVLVQPGSPCNSSDPVNGDALCQTNLANGHCSLTRNRCSCPEGKVYISNLKTCHKELFTEDCWLCQKSGGSCYDSDADQSPDGCECPSYKTSSSEDTMAVGCDIGLAEVGQFCGLDESVRCRPENSQCRSAGDLSGRAECRCRSGLVVHRTSQSDIRTMTECYRHLSRYTDPNCATCEANNGQCYDIDGDRLRDGCDCPVSRSSTDQDDPRKDCDVVHLNIACQKDAMTVCYSPHNNTIYKNIGERLSSGLASVYIRNHRGRDPCMFEERGNNWCLTLSLNTDDYEACGTTISFPTQSMISYQNYIVIQTEEQGLSKNDLSYHVYCQYDTKVHTAASGAAISDLTLKSSEGAEVHPVISFDVFDQFGRDATTATLGVGDPVYLKVEMTDNKNVYEAIRVELCIASNQPSLSTSQSSTILLLFDGCPTDNNYISARNTFTVLGNDPKVLQTGMFPILTFNNPSNVFFHCAVKVCRTKQECVMRICQSRKRRSDHNQQGIDRTKRGALVDSMGRLNDNLLKNLKTGAVKIANSDSNAGGGSNGGSSFSGDTSGSSADIQVSEETDDTLLIIGIVGGLVVLIVIIIIVFVCLCGGERRKRPVRSERPRMPYMPWAAGMMNPYQQMMHPSMLTPSQLAMLQQMCIQNQQLLNNEQLNQNAQGEGQQNLATSSPVQPTLGQQTISPNLPAPSVHTSSPAYRDAVADLPLIESWLLGQGSRQTTPEKSTGSLVNQLQMQNILLEMSKQTHMQELVASKLSNLLSPTSAASQGCPRLDTIAYTRHDRGLAHHHRHCHDVTRDSLGSAESYDSFIPATQITSLTGNRSHDFRIPRPQIVLPKRGMEKMYY